MSGKFAKNNVVVINDGVNIPVPSGTVLIVRSVFTYADTKEDARKTFCNLNVPDEAMVYFCSDCRGDTYFIPEYYITPYRIAGHASQDQDEFFKTYTISRAPSSDEIAMATLDEIRNIKYLLTRRNNRHQDNTTAVHHTKDTVWTPRPPVTKTKYSGLIGRLTKGW